MGNHRCILSYAHWRPRSKDKFAERSRKCIFVGYPFGKKAWRLYDLETNEFFISRDVTFFEDQIPGIANTGYVSPPVLQHNDPIDDWLEPTSPSRGSGIEPAQPEVHSTPPPTTTSAS